MYHAFGERLSRGRYHKEKKMKLITALDLQRWADTKESEGLMPELIRRLIHSSLNDIMRLSMPSGDSVSLPGFDGVIETSCGNAFVSSGTTVFEIGTNKEVKRKADKDINTRNGEVADEEKEGLTFVFVTPRKWANARKWEKENRETSKWKDVRVLTAVELEDWISQCPSVTAWLVTKIGILSDGAGVDSLEGYWNKWSVNAKGIRLDYGILTGGRETNVKALLEEVEQPNIVSVVSGSTEESFAFAVAAILSSGNYSLIDRCVVAKDEKSIQELLASYNNLVIITICEERNFSYGVANNRDSIIFATNHVSQSNYGAKITLTSHDYHLFNEALIKSGFEETEARRAAKDSGRNVMTLRHQQGFDMTNPEWTKRSDLVKIIPAILLGRWNESCEGDIKLLEEICGVKGEELEQLLQVWINLDNSPFQRVNNVWCVTSPYDAFQFVQNYLTAQLLDRFETVLKKALQDLDPNALEKMNPEMALYTLGKREYTGQLREGMCLNIILIALLLKGGQPRVDKFVKEVLESSDKKWWLTYSASDVVSFLAEASPKSFVEYIEEDIKNEKSVIRELFVPIKKNSFLSSGYEVEYTHILFALEMLAWMPDYLLRVCFILAELAKIPNESNFTNKPFNSLVDIFRLWFPKTSVDANGRSKAIGALLRKYPETGLKLCIALATKIRHQHVSFSSLVSRWRLKDVVSVGAVSGCEIYQVLLKICQLIANSGTPTPDDAISILDIATDCNIPLEFRNTLLYFIADQSQNFKGNKKLYERLMDLTNHFKGMPEAKWQISENEKQVLNELLLNIMPENTIDRLEYLLSNKCYRIPEIQHICDHQKRFAKVQELRLNAVNQIIDEIGVDAFLDYVVSLPEPHDTIMTFGGREDSFNYFEKICGLVKKDEVKYGSFRYYFRQLEFVNLERFIAEIEKRKNDEYIWFPLAAADPCEEIWNLVDSLDERTNRKYWENTVLTYIPVERVKYLNEHFMEVGRYHEVIQVLYHVMIDNKDNLDLPYVKDVMRKVMKHLNGQILSSSNYELERVMEWIDKNEKVTDQEIMALELPYIISQRGSVAYWRAYRIILQNPKFLFELIDCSCFSDNEEKMQEEIDEIASDPNKKAFAMFSATMLTEIYTMPCVDEKGDVDENDLKAYMAELIRLGTEKNKLSHVYHTIGRLLACYPKSATEKPPRVICEMIDEIDNKTLNNSYHARIYNRLGSTVRGPFDGGYIEWNKSKRFATIAEGLQVEFPVTAKIYSSLAAVYEEEAKRQDTKAEMLKLDS